MKRILSLAMVVLLVISCLAGCGDKNRILYNTKLSKYVDLGEYEGIKIDTSSEDYTAAYQGIIDSDVESNEFYETKTEGTVAEGDTANIDYEGKKDGVAFEGGTAAGYDLVIGSGSFIDGFEDGLIGATIGETIDLNLTFPEDYGNEELNGAAVVFTVTVNYVTTTNPLTPEQYYSELGFANLQGYELDVKERAIKEMLYTALESKSKIKEYPPEDKEYIYNETKNMYVTNYIEPYGYDLEGYLEIAGQTEEDFKNEIVTNSVEPLMDYQMLLYSVFDKAKLEVNNNEINAKAESLAEEIGEGVTAERVKEYYGEYYLEFFVVEEKALQYMYDNAIIE